MKSKRKKDCTEHKLIVYDLDAFYRLKTHIPHKKIPITYKNYEKKISDPYITDKKAFHDDTMEKEYDAYMSLSKLGREKKSDIDIEKAKNREKSLFKKLLSRLLKNLPLKNKQIRFLLNKSPSLFKTDS